MRTIRDITPPDEPPHCAHPDAEFITDEQPVAGVLGEIGWLERTWRCRKCAKTGVQRYKRALRPA